MNREAGDSVIHRTCGPVARARRVGFAIDAELYFDALAEALPRAQHSVWILGWDIHSGTKLDRRDPGAPELGALLDDLARDRPGLHIRILVWDHAMIYALEREFLPIYSFGFRTNRRMHFHHDDEHPLGASHHQKIVVIDDDLAFCGGLDLTIRRWDSPDHEPDDEARKDPQGEPYAPFHDAQVAVQGPAAAALADVARHRWRVATGQSVTGQTRADVEWPKCLAVDVEDVDVGVAITQPRHRRNEAIRQVEKMYLDAIGRAQKSIYIENQYLTANSIGEALERRLRAQDGPEVIIVGPRQASGWLEEATIGALRGRIIERLQAADEHDRLRLWYPRVRDQDVYVHSKVAIFDDSVITVGSANLSNRSMGFDSECNVVLEASGNDALAGAARQLRTRLLAEHLGVEPDRFDAAVREHGRLITATESLRGGERSLEPIEVPEFTELQRSLLSEINVVDPEGPIQLDAFVEKTIPKEERPRGFGRYLRVGLIIGLVVAIVAAWRFTSLSEIATIENLTGWLAPMQKGWWGPGVTFAAFVLGGLVFFPITVLILYAAIAHGPWMGLSVTLAGVAGNAALTYGIGTALGRKAVRRLVGSKLNRISKRLARRGLLAVLAVRIVPVAPFTVINLVAGASHVRFRDYMLGTALGMLPGIIAMTLLGDRLWQVLIDPSVESLIVLGLVVVAVITGLVLLMRRFGRSSSSSSSSSSSTSSSSPSSSTSSSSSSSSTSSG